MRSYVFERISIRSGWDYLMKNSSKRAIFLFFKLTDAWPQSLNGFIHLDVCTVYTIHIYIQCTMSWYWKSLNCTNEVLYAVNDIEGITNEHVCALKWKLWNDKFSVSKSIAQKRKAHLSTSGKIPGIIQVFSTNRTLEELDVCSNTYKDSNLSKHH